MKFLCGSCRTKYQIADDKVRGKVLTIRCKKCGAKVVVREALARESSIAVAPLAGEEATHAAAANAPSSTSRQLAQAFDAAMHGSLDDMPTSIAPTPSNEAHAGVEWYVAIDGQQSGPFAYGELVAKLKRRDVAGRHYVWHDGFDNWKRVREVPDLAQYVPGDTSKPDARKKPPPPPEKPTAEAGAEVVDFAQKRAERERKTRDPSLDPTEARREVVPSRVDAAPAAIPRSDPPESLSTSDLVPFTESLVEKPSISPAASVPGSVPLVSSPGAAALGGGVGLAPAMAREPSGDAFIPEDLFDKVPRASQQELVSRESTRFFVAAAGVNQQKSRNRLGVVVGAGAGVALLLFMGLWGSGVIKMSLPGIGNPFAKAAATEVEEAGGPVELSADDRKLLAGLKGAEKEEKLKELRARRPKSVGGASAGPKGSAALAYVDSPDEKGGESRGSRGGDAPQEAASIDKDLARMGAGPGGTEVGGNAPAREGRAPDMPEIETGDLPAETIRRVISDNRQAVSFCYQRERLRTPDVKGRIDFSVTVEPTGAVSSVGMDTPAFKGTSLASCISEKINAWRFPAFKGTAKQVHVPFVLQP